MSKFLKNNLLSLLILIIILIILLKTCGGRGAEPTTTVTVFKDTVWVHKDSTITNQPQIIDRIEYPVEVRSTEYLPDTGYDRLVKQYVDLVDKYLATNVALDSIRIDSIGYVKIFDSISKNEIARRSITYSIKHPVIKEVEIRTVTVPEEKRGQMYIGGGGMIRPQDMRQLITQGQRFVEPNVGLLYKTKNDFIVGATAGVDRLGQPQYGMVTYFKIRLKKRNK